MKSSIGLILKTKSTVLFICASMTFMFCWCYTAGSFESDDRLNEESCHCGRDLSKERKYNEEDRRDYCLAKNFPSPREADRRKNMVKIEAGIFAIGTNHPVFVADGEGPKRQVSLDSFYIDELEVSNREFSAFVDATAYRTEAEAFGDSFVFGGLLNRETEASTRVVVARVPWWLQMKNASWLHPEGFHSDVTRTYATIDCNYLTL